MVDGVELDIEAFRNSRPEYNDAIFLLEDGSVSEPGKEVDNLGKYICGTEVEKMSKSKYNTVNPDTLVEKYGADTFRMYEMFLGPVEMSKPWDTKGIEGVHRFLKKLWRLYVADSGSLIKEEKASPEELKVLHKTIKKIEEDTERFSFNTCISAFMVCVNELTDLKCNKREVLEAVLILLTPYAPHVAEELWDSLGNKTTVLDAPFPKWEQSHLTENTKEYPISVNGKLRTTMVIDLAAEQPQVEGIVLQNEVIQKWLGGKQPKKIIFVKGKMVNIVV
jgi:leucyl-tRNA synthetase